MPEQRLGKGRHHFWVRIRRAGTHQESVGKRHPPIVNVIPALGPAGQAARAPVRGADCSQRVLSTLTFGSGGVGDAEELALEVRDGFVGTGDHRAGQECGLTSDPRHYGVGDVGVGRGDC